MGANTQDEWDRAREKEKPADPATEKPLLADTLEIEERAAAIACHVLGEYAAEQCESLDDVAAVPDADHGGPVHDALRLVARFLVHDHFEFGSERSAAVRAALGIGDVSPARQAEEQAEAAVAGMSSSKLLALCVRLAAHPLILDDHAEPLPREMLEWAELDWPNLQDQARRELAGGPTADQRLAAAEAAAEPAPPTVTPIPVGAMLQDLDVPDAELDAACEQRKAQPPLQMLAAMISNAGPKDAAELILDALKAGQDPRAVARQLLPMLEQLVRAPERRPLVV